MYQILYLRQEPLIDAGYFTDRLQWYAHAHGIFDQEQAVPAGVLQAMHDLINISFVPAICPKTGPADLQTLTCFLQGFDKSTADGHYLTYRFHL
ncbi:hypothetical protein D3C86_1409400 [compost metagenome]